jgi:LmbE family N-acetylglucosaminyl deacetylase
MQVKENARNVTMTQGQAIHQIAKREGESASETLRRAIERREGEARKALRDVERLKRALRILGVPQAPWPVFVTATHGNVTSYAMKCEGEGIMAFGESINEAQESWRKAYIDEYIGDVSF